MRKSGPLAPAARARKIIHVDMDAFFAAIEQRDEPRLRGRPIAVGGSGPRSVVLTASYEARVFGVRSAMPTSRALRLCPDLVMVRPRFPAYRLASAAMQEVFAVWATEVEPLSLDEAYLDVTAASANLPAADIARAIKAEIHARTGLTASAGVSFNKFLAKLASDLEKPDGLTVIRPRDAAPFIAALPVDRFHGVGPATASRLLALGIGDGAGLQAADPRLLYANLGRFGLSLHAMAHGRDERPVRSDRPRKSLSVEETLDTDITDVSTMWRVLSDIAAELAGRCERSNFGGRTLTLKIKFADFTLRTRSITGELPLQQPSMLREAAQILLYRPEPPNRPVRLLGLSLANAETSGSARQLSLLA
jgi:DNA polymerase IV